MSVTRQRPPTPFDDTRRRVHSQVALGLLRTLRDQDLPGEVLDDENLTATLPRRLGLSDAVDAQIRRYEDAVRRRRRITDREMGDLIHLVTRRPDSREVFLRVGAELHGGERTKGIRRLMPRRLRRAMARRRIRQRLRGLFGRQVVSASGAPFRLESVDDYFVRFDPGGDACALITGLARSELARSGTDTGRLVHVRCRGRGDEACIWGLKDQDPTPVNP